MQVGLPSCHNSCLCGWESGGFVHSCGLFGGAWPLKSPIRPCGDLPVAVLPIIRKSNPTRVVFFGGLQFMNPSWIQQNPETLYFPPEDRHLALEVHNYDPYRYAGAHPTTHSWGSASDRAAVEAWVTNLTRWAKEHSRAILLGEFGVTHNQTAATGRVEWYVALSEARNDVAGVFFSHETHHPP